MIPAKIFMTCILVMATNAASATEGGSLHCGRDEIEDEVVAMVPLKEHCAEKPKGLKNLTDFNGGGLFGDDDSNGAKPRGFNFSLSKEQPNSHGTAKLCFYKGCRRLAVRASGLPPGHNSQHWNTCLNFTGRTNQPHKRDPNCPAAIKIYGKFRELIPGKTNSDGRNCCYEVDPPVAPGR